MNRLATCWLMMVMVLVAGSTSAAEKKADKKVKGKQPEKTVAVQKQAPDFKIKDSEGNLIDLAKLTASGARR